MDAFAAEFESMVARDNANKAEEDKHQGFFNLDYSPVREIAVDRDDIYKEYCVTMYQRMRTAAESNQGALQEATRESDDVVTVLVTKFNDSTAEDRVFEQSEVTSTLKTTVDGQQIMLPVPRSECVEKWTNSVERWIDDVNTSLLDISEFRCEVKDDQRKAKQLATSTKLKVKHTKEKAVRAILELQLLEKCLQKWLKLLADQCVEVKARVDQATDGLWLSGGTLMPQSATCGKRYEAVEKIERMSFTNTQNIAKVCFSNSSHIRAEAKLNLSASLDEKIFKRIISKPEKMLAIVCTQACLTPQETLSIVFPLQQDKRNSTCLACGTATELGNYVYHKKCKVIDWLVEYAPFSYDSKEGNLRQERRVYFTAEWRNL